MKHVWRSFKDAYAGLAYCFATQRNMVIHGVFGSLILLAALLLRVGAPDFLLILAAVWAVLAAEVFNTAVEKVVDLCTREQNDLAHIAKDVAAGAVLLTAVFAVLIGLYVFGPRLWRLFSPGGN